MLEREWGSMARFKRWIIISIIITCIVDILVLASSFKKETRNIDIVYLNRLSRMVTKYFENPEMLDTIDAPFEFVVIDSSNHLLYKNGTIFISSLQEAIRQKATYYPVTKGEQLMGYLIVENDIANGGKLDNRSTVVLLVFTWIIEIFYLLGLYNVFCRMIKPFQKMEKFTTDIALGNLDRPLDMDNDNLFGAFTVSFDIMREELKKARRKESQANESKKELVASLSHDIKTPVTAIKLISDILLVKLQNEELVKKVKIIYNKADQIDLLITDMFHATLEELGELSVEVVDIKSNSIKEMIESTDYNNRILDPVTIPECIISADPLRLQQVIANIISNSYKYADTRIEVTSFIDDLYLVVELRDFGTGIPEDEIHLVFEKFYRSKGDYVKEKQGSGLGLYISRFLMEKMEGGITCYNTEEGFVVKISVLLS